jgi:hypothetical protein
MNIDKKITDFLASKGVVHPDTKKEAKSQYTQSAQDLFLLFQQWEAYKNQPGPSNPESKIIVVEATSEMTIELVEGAAAVKSVVYDLKAVCPGPYNVRDLKSADQRFTGLGTRLCSHALIQALAGNIVMASKEKWDKESHVEFVLAELWRIIEGSQNIEPGKNGYKLTHTINGLDKSTAAGQPA